MKTLAGTSKEERKRVRKTLGSLKTLTVQPRTRARYSQGLDLFFKYVREAKLTLPKKRDKLDDLCADYLEYLWSEGEGRAVASNFLAAIQDYDPKIRGCLPSCWRLMKAWNAHELPSRAPPLPEPVLRAMVGWSFFHKKFQFGLSLLVGFYGLLRTGELLGLQNFQVQMISPSQPAVLSLGLTKSGKRQGAAESVTLTEAPVLRFLWDWKRTAKAHDFLTAKPHIWREQFNECLRAMKLSPWEFRPYSLRRGGATFYAVKSGSLDRVLLLGRWTAIKTVQAELEIPNVLLKPFHQVFAHALRSPPQLERTGWGTWRKA